MSASNVKTAFLDQSHHFTTSIPSTKKDTIYISAHYFFKKMKTNGQQLLDDDVQKMMVGSKKLYHSLFQSLLWKSNYYTLTLGPPFLWTLLIVPTYTLFKELFNKRGFSMEENLNYFWPVVWRLEELCIRFSDAILKTVKFAFFYCSLAKRNALFIGMSATGARGAYLSTDLHSLLHLQCARACCCCWSFIAFL